MIEYATANPILSLLIGNVIVSIILAIRILRATTPAYKELYRQAAGLEKIILIYSVFNYSSDYIAEEGLKYRPFLLVSAVTYLFLLFYI